jgi:diguanylate cyclase (GGDEF)-like protein
MSVRVLIAACTLTLVAAILGCTAIARSKNSGRGLWWLVAALGSALAAILLFAGIPFLSPFLTIVVANEAILIAYILLYQSVASILQSPRRFISLGVLLVVFQLFFYLRYTYVVPDLRSRVMARSIALAIVAAVSAIVLFRHSDRTLRYPAWVVGWYFAAFSGFQVSRIVVNFIWPPSPDRLHPGPAQAFYNCFNFMLGMGACLSVVWLAVCAQREDLQLMATTDALSGLMNRRAFDEVLQRVLRCAERRHGPVALMLIDLDHFKAINDLFGHGTGDEVIRRVGRLLQVNTRAADVVARYGGEEFVMLLRGMSLDQAEFVAERLRLQIESMTGLPDQVSVTASIGIAIRWPEDTAASLLKRSDEALYASKHAGRNRVTTEYPHGEPVGSALYLN